MAFSEEVVRQAWLRAGGKCECTRTSHTNHFSYCGQQLIWESRGREDVGAWEAHHRDANGGDTLSNCEILCWSCHKQTL